MRQKGANRRVVCGFFLRWSCLYKAYLEDVGVRAFVLTPIFCVCRRARAPIPSVYPCACSWPCLHSELPHLSPPCWAVSRARITHFKATHCHTLMWQTAASAIDISTRWDWIFPLRWGRKSGVGGNEEQGETKRESQSEGGLFTSTLLCQHQSCSLL